MIKSDLKINNINYFIINEELQESLDEVECYVSTNVVDLIIFTRHHVSSYSEYRIMKKFLNTYNVCTLIDSYDRWFSKMPRIRFNDRYLISRSLILDWLFCKLLFKKYSLYYISEIHPESHNPLKVHIRARTSKIVFEIPFKIKKKRYHPIVAHNDLVRFVIPGSIDKHRRDYDSILKVFMSSSIKKLDWQLVLLGRPVGHYGKRIVDTARKFNITNNNKVKYYDSYIGKKEYLRHLNNSDYIIAPIIPSKYKKGKDSGAIYDAFVHNKIGIINKKYFYSNDLPEKDVMITYDTLKSLKTIIGSILNGIYDTSYLYRNMDTINNQFNESNYKHHLNKALQSYFN